MRVEFSYSIGYGRHKDEVDIDDDNLTDDEIDKEIQDIVLDRLDWSWKKASK